MIKGGHEKNVQAVIRDIGMATRKRINELPEEDRDNAWAFVASAIYGAALHDSTDPRRTLDLMSAVTAGMVPTLLAKDLTDLRSRDTDKKPTKESKDVQTRLRTGTRRTRGVD
jgi:hypothetical protein